MLEQGPSVIATGGGAFMNSETRDAIRANGVSVWLRADLEILLRRTGRRDHRPLLRKGNPRETLGRLMAERYPVYAEADLVVDTGAESPDATTDETLRALERHLSRARDARAAGR